MERKDEEKILGLASQVPELQELWSEHVDFKEKLDKLNHKLYLTPEEEFERKNIQKRKLAGKDRMMSILAQYRETETRAENRPGS